MKRILLLLVLLIGFTKYCKSQSSSSLNNWVSGYFIGWNGTTNDLEIRTNNITKITVSGSTNNVGIGKIIPSFQLCVASHISIDTLMVYPTIANGQIGCYMLRDSTVLHNIGLENIFTGVGAGISINGGTDNTFNGFNAGRANTGGANNVFVGSKAGLVNTTGYSNVYLGSSAGASNIFNGGNTYVGAFAGQNTNTAENTFVGSSAGVSASGNTNVFVGGVAGNFSSGSANVIIGYATGGFCGGDRNVIVGTNSAQSSIFSGGENVLVGYHVGLNNTTGRSNCYSGFESGNTNTIGSNNCFYGYQTGYTNVSNTDNTFNGYQAGYSNTADKNTFIGSLSGYTNSSNSGQTFVGYKSGTLTTGANNTFIGFESGAGNGSSAGNTFLGYHTGLASTASNNTLIGTEAGVATGGATGLTFLGYHAGFGSNTGNNNTFLGSESGADNNSGADNTFNGYNAGISNGGGSKNTFVGSAAGASNTGKFNSTYVGYRAGYNINAKQNTIVGSNSGYGIGGTAATGEQNTFLGESSGSSIITGNLNTYLGWNTGPTTTTYSAINNSTAIGSNAEVKNSNQMILGDLSVNVGIGLSGDATGPQNKLEINANGAYNSLTPFSGLRFTDMRSGSTSIAGTGKVLSVNSTGDVILVNDDGAGSVSICGASLPINYITKATGSTTLCNSDIFETSALDVGIGTTAPAAKLNVKVCATGNASAVIGQFEYSNANTTATLNAIGVYANTNIASGNSNAGFESVTNGGIACYGYYADVNNTNTPTSENYGFHATVKCNNGATSATPSLNYGMRAQVTVMGDYTVNHGVYTAVGNTSFHPGYNYGGYFLSSDAENNYGIKAQSLSQTTNSSTAKYYAVYGFAAGTSASFGSKETYGGWFEARYGTSLNYGVYATGGQICDTNPSTTNCSNAAGYFSGDVGVTHSLYQSSDLFLKDNIQPINNATVLLNQLNPVAYNYKTQQYPSMHLGDGTHYGLIAEEVKLLLPQVVRGFAEPEVKDTLGNIITPQVDFQAINYTAFIPILIEGFQVQQAKIDSLTAAIALLSNPLLPKIQNNTTPQKTGVIDVKLTNIENSILYQNEPNPYTSSTTIRYFIPENTADVKITFQDATGKTLKEVKVNETGQGSIELDGSNLINGIYTYSLVIGNKVVDTKKMVKQ